MFKINVLISGYFKTKSQFNRHRQEMNLGPSCSLLSTTHTNNCFSVYYMWPNYYFPWLSMTFQLKIIKFHDFPGLENKIPEFHDRFSMTHTNPAITLNTNWTWRKSYMCNIFRGIFFQDKCNKIASSNVIGFLRSILYLFLCSIEHRFLDVCVHSLQSIETSRQTLQFNTYINVTMNISPPPH